MNLSAKALRWYEAWHPAPAAEPDFADLGTAFGLDLSLSALTESGLGAGESPRRTSDEGLDGADDQRRAWAR